MPFWPGDCEVEAGFADRGILAQLDSALWIPIGIDDWFAQKLLNLLISLHFGKSRLICRVLAVAMGANLHIAENCDRR